MAGLINARAIVTTTGHLTEPVWADTGAVALAAARDTDALRRRRAACSRKTTTVSHSPRGAEDVSGAVCAPPHDSRPSRSA